MTRKGKIISDDRIMKKYELTPIMEDDEYMKDYMMETLKDFKNDKPSKDYEFSRKSNETNGVLDRRYGRKTDNDIYKPDLFLGDLTKDPRSIADSADLNGFRKFMEHRKEALKINLLNDDNMAVNSKTLTHAESRRKKDETFYRVKKRYTNYENSKEGLNHGKSLFNLSNGSKNLEKNKSLSTYVINSHKSNYTNRHKLNNGSKWISEYKHKSASGLKDVDYSEGKRNLLERISDKIYGNGNVKYISPFKSAKKSRNSSYSHNTEKINSMNITDSNERYNLKKPTIQNFAERKLESLDDMKLTSKSSYNMKEIKNKGVKNIDNEKMRESFSNQIVSHKDPNASKYILERLNRNSMILKEKDSILIRNVDAKTHKMNQSTQPLEMNNKFTKQMDNKDIKDIIRMSQLTGDRISKMSKENNQSLYSKGNIKKVLNPSQDILKFAVNNPDMNSTKKAKDEITIYNFKSKKPEKFKFLENGGVMEIGLYSHTKESSVMDKHGNKSGKTDYKIKNIEDFDLEVKPSHYDQREVKMASGTTGIMGSKFVRDKLELEVSNNDLESGMERISRLK
jgi:hypothetical protein